MCLSHSVPCWETAAKLSALPSFSIDDMLLVPWEKLAWLLPIKSHLWEPISKGRAQQWANEDWHLGCCWAKECIQCKISSFTWFCCWTSDLKCKQPFQYRQEMLITIKCRQSTVTGASETYESICWNLENSCDCSQPSYQCVVAGQPCSCY